MDRPGVSIIPTNISSRNFILWFESCDMTESQDVYIFSIILLLAYWKLGSDFPIACFFSAHFPFSVTILALLKKHIRILKAMLLLWSCLRSQTHHLYHVSLLLQVAEMLFAWWPSALKAILGMICTFDEKLWTAWLCLET